MVAYTCNKVFDRYANDGLHMQTAHGIALSRKKNNVDDPLQNNKIQQYREDTGQ